MEDKIENNPSNKKFRKELEGAKNLQKVLSFFGMNSKEIDKAFDGVPDIESQLNILSKSPDKFNDHYAKRGWIAHESMNSDLMLSCIELAEKGLIDTAEIELVNYYTSEKIRPQLKRSLYHIDMEFFMAAILDILTKS